MTAYIIRRLLWMLPLLIGVSVIKHAWRNALIPIVTGSAIFITVLAFNFLGDGIRDAMDPYLQHR